MVAAKMWAALLGSIVTALLASPVVPVEGTAHLIFTIISVVVTAFATYAIPNRPSP